jgi:hypothetical protein
MQGIIAAVRKNHIVRYHHGLYLLAMVLPSVVFPQTGMPDQILEIFENKCAFSGCHAGTGSGNGLELTEETAYASLVAQPSTGSPNLLLVKPGDPLNSYLMMKLVGVSGIKGARMPKGDARLSKAELTAVAGWIKTIAVDTRTITRKRIYNRPFPGLSLATLQTAQTLPSRSFSYRIAHRWLGSVNSGFGQFFGLDQGAHMLTEFSFAVTDRVTFTAGRSGTNATFAFYTKWQLLQERSNGSVPVSLALLGGLDWLTLKQISDPNNPAAMLSRTSGDRFPLYAQLIMSKQISNRIAFLLSPGVLSNGNVTVSNEDPIITLGFGIRLLIANGLSLFAEGVPLLSGSDTALPVGGSGTQNSQATVFDAFTFGLEHHIGGHIFHVYVTNALALTPGQLMNGGNLDFSSGKFRLGFNIYRTFRLPF